jgi:hypothetical protein
MRAAPSSAHVLVLCTDAGIRPAAPRGAAWPAAPAPAATPFASIRGFDAPAAETLGGAIARGFVTPVAWPALTASAGRRSAVVTASMAAAAARSSHTTVHCTGVFRRGFDLPVSHSAAAGIITIYA